MNVIPDDAIAHINGSYYKLGRFERMYRWANNEWVKSEMTAVQVIRAVTAKTFETNDNRWV